MGIVKPGLIQKFLNQTRTIRSPKKLLSTFGATRIEYHLVSPVDDLPNKARLREGLVVSQRPNILTSEALRQRFEGFGDSIPEFSDFLGREFRDLLRALEYTFKNEALKTSVIAKDPHDAACSIRDDLDRRDIPRSAVIECPDAAWSLAIMRFTLEEAARSFGTNVRDMETRGMFDPEERDDKRRRSEIERLFAAAPDSESARDRLGAALRAYGLFDEYEDRFLSLYR